MTVDTSDYSRACQLSYRWMTVLVYAIFLYWKHLWITYIGTCNSDAKFVKYTELMKEKSSKMGKWCIYVLMFSNRNCSFMLWKSEDFMKQLCWLDNTRLIKVYCMCHVTPSEAGQEVILEALLIMCLVLLRVAAAVLQRWHVFILFRLEEKGMLHRLRSWEKGCRVPQRRRTELNIQVGTVPGVTWTPHAKRPKHRKKEDWRR